MKNTNTQLGAALGTIGKTEEQLAAEQQAQHEAEKQARWAKEIERRSKLEADHAEKKAPFRCEARVSSGRASVWTSQCSANAKFDREEPIDSWDKTSPKVTRHYCKTHDPISQQERMNKKEAERRAEYDRERMRRNTIERRNAVIVKLVGNLTTEQLELILEKNPTVLPSTAHLLAEVK